MAEAHHREDRHLVIGPPATGLNEAKQRSEGWRAIWPPNGGRGLKRAKDSLDWNGSQATPRISRLVTSLGLRVREKGGACFILAGVDFPWFVDLQKVMLVQRCWSVAHIWSLLPLGFRWFSFARACGLPKWPSPKHVQRLRSRSAWLRRPTRERSPQPDETGDR